MSNSSDFPIAAIATSVGEAGISVIRISGADCITLFSKIWKGKDLSKQPGNTIVFGRLVHNGTMIDEVLVSVFRAPHSYTGEDVLEVSCHGGYLNTHRVLDAILSSGFRAAGPGEFTHRAFLNGKMDLTQAEAVADIIHARSEAALRNASRQLEGALGSRMKEFRQQLIDFTALIELELDFSEEDVEFARREQLIALLKNIQTETHALLESYEAGRLVRDGVHTAIVGLPNAGKSTLLNALLQQDRAIVSPIAGTTRDTIEAEWNHRGLRFILVDTAGIRHTEDHIEALGVARSKAAVTKADLMLLVLDATDPSQTKSAVLQQLGIAIPKHTVLLTVANKADVGIIQETVDTIIAAKNNVGIAELKDRMWQKAMGNRHWDPDRFVLTSARHKRELSSLLEQVNLAIRQLSTQVSGEFVASSLRNALQHLSAITGQISNEDILDSIFSRFCIGK